MPKSPTSTTTGHSRRHRHGPVLEELGFASRFVSGQIEPQPAVTATPPRPAGELGTAPVERIARLVTAAWDGAPATCQQRGQAAGIILNYLADYEGSTWQQRWDASPMGRGEVNASILGSRRETGMAIGQGLRSLFCLRVLQPSLLAFRVNKFHEYGQFFVAAQGDPLLEKFAEQAAAAAVSWAYRQEALFDVCCLLTVQGVALADLTPPALLHYGHETRRVRAIMLPGRKYSNRFAGLSAWNILHQMGHFPPGTPSTMREALSRGELTIEQMVDRYPIRNQTGPATARRLLHPPRRRHRLHLHLPHGPGGHPPLLGEDRTDQPRPGRPAHQPGGLRDLAAHDQHPRGRQERRQATSRCRRHRDLRPQQASRATTNSGSRYPNHWPGWPTDETKLTCAA